MTVSLRVLVPEETTNYVLNPQFRIDTTGWTANSATITRTLDRARFGVASLKVVTSGLALNEGVFYRAKNLVGISDSLTASIYVRGAGKVRIRLIDNPRGKEFRGDAVALDDKRWHRLEVTGTITGSDDVRLYVENADSAVKSITYYVDGAQLERKLYSTTYCDGYQPGCRWNIYENNSLSTRQADVSIGGRWVPIAKPCRPNNDLYCTLISGLGMPPLTTAYQSFSSVPGSYVQGYKVDSRVLTFAFTVKNKDMRLNKAPDLTEIHALRQQLLDVLKPDITVGGNISFEYTENGIPLYFRGRYDGGLEGEWDIRNKWVNSIPLRIFVAQPMLQEDSQEAMQLDFQDTFNPGAGKITAFGRISDVWSKMSVSGTGPNDDVFCLVRGKNGEVFAGGSFTSIDGVVACNRIAYWDGTVWNAMGSGANGNVYAIAVAANGDVYATGDFTTIGGVACNRIAKWNGTVWSALSTGLSSSGRALCIAPNGVLYAGGDFATAGGVTVNRLARWDGFRWQTVGTGATPGLGATVRAIVNWIDGNTIFVGGDFTFSSQHCVVSVNTTTNVIDNMGAYLNAGSCRALAVGFAGDLYAGGVSLTTAGGSSSLLVWNGTGWILTATDFNGNVYALSIDYRGYVYVGGDFTLVGGIPARYLAIFGGAAVWLDADIVPNSPGAAIVSAVLVTPLNQDVYIGLTVTSASNTYVAGVTKVSNPGTSFTNPVFYFVGPGKLYYIENRKTRVRMYFNLDVLSGEEIFVDTVNATVYSLTRGSTLYGILPAAALGLFQLLPGDNYMHVLFFKDVGSKAQILFTPQHWSVDATGQPSAL